MQIEVPNEFTLGYRDYPDWPGSIRWALSKNRFLSWLQKRKSKRFWIQERFEGDGWLWRYRRPCEMEYLWPLGTENGSRLTARKRRGTSVLRSQGTRFCQQSERAWNQNLPQSFQIRVSLTNTLISALWHPTQRTQPNPRRPLNYRSVS